MYNSFSIVGAAEWRPSHPQHRLHEQHGSLQVRGQEQCGRGPAGILPLPGTIISDLFNKHCNMGAC